MEVKYLEDDQIIALYEAREEEAIEASDVKYGGLCRKLAVNILRSGEDAEECVNDTWLAAWNRIPPEKPQCLKAFFARIARNLSLNRLDYLRAAKRDVALTESYDALAELGQDLAAADVQLERLADDELREIINDFLGNMSREMRVIFLRRYWFGESIGQLAEATGYSQSKIKSMLHRTRLKLRQWLQQKGVEI